MEQFCLNPFPHRLKSHTGGVFFKLTSQFSELQQAAANNCIGTSEVGAAFSNPKGAVDW